MVCDEIQYKTNMSSKLILAIGSNAQSRHRDEFWYRGIDVGKNKLPVPL